MAEPSIAQILESESYKHQKEVTNRAINKNVHITKIDGTLYAPARLADLCRVHSVDYSVFKKTETEHNLAFNLKKRYEKEMKQKFPQWTRKQSTKPEYLSINVKNIW